MSPIFLSYLQLTLCIIKNQLLLQFPELESISRETVRRALHNQLRMSFKKVGSVLPKMQTQSNVTLLCECFKVLQTMLQSDYYLVFIDEFMKSLNHSNWNSESLLFLLCLLLSFFNFLPLRLLYS